MPHPSRLAILAVFVLGLVVPNAGAGSPTDPEIVDAVGDADPVALLGVDPDPLAGHVNLSGYDLVSGWVIETRTMLFVYLQVVNLTGGIEFPQPPPLPPPPPPVPPVPPVPPLMMPQQHATYDYHFTVTNGSYFVRAQLEAGVKLVPSEPPNPPTPIPYVLSNFTLHQDDADETLVKQVAGFTNTWTQNIVWFVPKDAIGSPAPSTLMDGMYAVAHTKGVPVDHAPAANGVDPDSVTAGNPELVPTFGRPYQIGQFFGSGFSTLVTTPEGRIDGITEPGVPLEFGVTVTSQGIVNQTVALSARPPFGWQVTFDTEEIVLAPDESVTVGFTAVPTAEARRGGIVSVRAANLQTAQYADVLYSVRLNATFPDESTGMTSGTDSKKDTPAPAPLALVAAAALGLAWARRRL